MSPRLRDVLREAPRVYGFNSRSSSPGCISLGRRTPGAMSLDSLEGEDCNLLRLGMLGRVYSEESNTPRQVSSTPFFRQPSFIISGNFGTDSDSDY